MWVVPSVFAIYDGAAMILVRISKTCARIPKGSHPEVELLSHKKRMFTVLDVAKLLSKLYWLIQLSAMLSIWSLKLQLQKRIT